MDRRHEDSGVTLIEVLAAMAAFAVVLLVFMDAVRVMTTSLSRVSTVTVSATQTRAATDVLGRQLGYASSANLPYYDSSSGNWYFEFESDAVKAGDDSRCTQWRYRSSSHSLEYRSWSVVTLAAGPWTTVTGSLVNDPVTQPPFTLLPSDAGFSVMRVVVDLRLAAAGTVVESQGQYTLRNSLEAPVPTTSTVCTQLGRP
jgi:prepilin-type N-terminal cleavage/methylation domain-containing protein